VIVIVIVVLVVLVFVWRRYRERAADEQG